MIVKIFTIQPAYGEKKQLTLVMSGILPDTGLDKNAIVVFINEGPIIRFTVKNVIYCL